MVRAGKWSIELRVDGTPLREHDIDGHTCVGSKPGAEFDVVVEFHGPAGRPFVVDIEIDGKKVAAQRCLDPDGLGSRGRSSKWTCKGWEKSEAGHVVTRAFQFQAAGGGGGDDDDDEGRPAVADWTRGVVTLKAYTGVARTVMHDSLSLDHKADLSRGSAISEKQQVKAGLGTSAGAGSTSFSTSAGWKAGEVCIDPAPGDPVEVEASLYYRDSFFMCMREATCCGGQCEAEAQQRIANGQPPPVAPFGSARARASEPRAPPGAPPPSAPRPALARALAHLARPPPRRRRRGRRGAAARRAPGARQRPQAQGDRGGARQAAARRPGHHRPDRRLACDARRRGGHGGIVDRASCGARMRPAYRMRSQSVGGCAGGGARGVPRTLPT